MRGKIAWNDDARAITLHFTERSYKLTGVLQSLGQRLNLPPLSRSYEREHLYIYSLYEQYPPLLCPAQFLLPADPHHCQLGCCHSHQVLLLL